MRRFVPKGSGLAPCSRHVDQKTGRELVFDRKMIMNVILVCLVCQCNVYVITESIRRKDLGYKGYEFLTIANFVALLLLPCLLDFNLVSLSVGT